MVGQTCRRLNMETFSALLAIYAVNPRSGVDSFHKGFDVSFAVVLNKPLNKQSISQ